MSFPDLFHLDQYLKVFSATILGALKLRPTKLRPFLLPVGLVFDTPTVFDEI